MTGRLRAECLATVLLLLGSTASLAAAPDDVVVSIMTVPAKGKPALGSGVFISSQGEILTCYHVIANSSTIDVIYGGQVIHSAVVKAFSAQYDLAIIRVRMSSPVPFAPILRQLPGSLRSTRLDVIGYPSVSSSDRSQHLNPRATRDGFYLSQDFRDTDTDARIFALRNVHLIGLDMTTYPGLSGAPLLYQGKVIGVIQGSLQVGGSVAWAIPLEYIDQLTLLEKAPSKVGSWPPLQLMSGPDNLRREANIGIPLARALDRYGSAVDQIETILLPLFASPLLNQSLQKFKNVVNTEIKARGPDAVADDRFYQKLLASLSKEELEWMQTLERLLDEPDSGLDDPDEAQEELKQELTGYFDRLPTTKRNLDLKASTLRRLAHVEQALDDIQKSMSLPDFEDDDDDDDVTLGEFRERLNISDQLIAKGALNILPVGLRQARAYQDVIESVFQAAPDLKH